MSRAASRAHLCEHVHAAPPVTPASLLLTRRRLIVGLGMLLVAFAFAAGLRNGQLLLTWDAPIQRQVEASRTSMLDTTFLTISRLGSQMPVLVLGTLAALVTWRRCRAVSTALFVATFSRPLIEFVIKAVVGRERPDFERLVAGNGPSFPSGHVMAAIALWGLLPVVVSLYTRSRRVWWGSVWVSVGLIVSIAASRVYLGVHWFSDVTMGLVVGAFFLIGVEAILHREHRRHPCRFLPVEGDERDALGEVVPVREPVLSRSR
ncbi:MAG TPA: phosphatase PAP2 family protein [Acidimicrobiales bacterium]|nr:phosphatase PAP2 family protein [Acidimicrobiales bacterium]